MAKTIMHIHEFAKALAAAGVIHEEDLNNINRIVIDADAKNGILLVHITRVGDDSIKIAEAIGPVLKGLYES